MFYQYLLELVHGHIMLPCLSEIFERTCFFHIFWQMNKNPYASEYRNKCLLFISIVLYFVVFVGCKICVSIISLYSIKQQLNSSTYIYIFHLFSMFAVVGSFQILFSGRHDNEVSIKSIREMPGTVHVLLSFVAQNSRSVVCRSLVKQ
jgi:hypothetical protein